MSISKEADQSLNGLDPQSYGEAKEHLRQVADVWSALLKHTITPEQVALCMIGQRLVSESRDSHRANLAEICRCTALLEKLKHETCEVTNRPTE